MSNVLDREIDTYEKNWEHLLEENENMWFTFHLDDYIGPFNCNEDAIRAGYRRYGNVPMLVRQIMPYPFNIDNRLWFPPVAMTVNKK